MAVPFHVPEANASSTSAVSSTTSSATMTAPQPQNPTTTTSAAAMSPVNSEYLVQAFCEALYRYSRAGGSLTAPPSPSCAPYGMFTFDSHLDDLSLPSPRRFRSHSLSAPLPRQLSRQRLPSQNHDMTDDDDDNTDENFNEEANYMEEHYNYMVARERLQEFSGRVPQQRKKKATDSEHNPQQQHREVKKDEENKVKNKPKEKFAWPLVALGVLALGCGLLATTR